MLLWAAGCFKQAMESGALARKRGERPRVPELAACRFDPPRCRLLRPHDKVRDSSELLDERIGLFSSFEIRPAFHGFPGGWWSHSS
jgi:hypothetical protein